MTAANKDKLTSLYRLAVIVGGLIVGGLSTANLKQGETIEVRMRIMEYKLDEHKASHVEIYKRIDKQDFRIELIEEKQYSLRQGRANYTTNEN